jgi:hypothetical protein
MHMLQHVHVSCQQAKQSLRWHWQTAATAADYWLPHVCVCTYLCVSLCTALYCTHLSQALTVLLVVPDALRRVAPVQYAVRAAHMILGLVIQLPALVLSFLPVVADLQTRMLFNSSFSARFAVAKIFAQQGRRNKVEKLDKDE